MYLARIKIRWCRVAMILWRRRKTCALEDGRVAQLSCLWHVYISVHPRAVLVRVVVTRTRLGRWSRSVVSSPVQVVPQLFFMHLPRRRYKSIKYVEWYTYVAIYTVNLKMAYTWFDIKDTLTVLVQPHQPRSKSHLEPSRTWSVWKFAVKRITICATCTAFL